MNPVGGGGGLRGGAPDGGAAGGTMGGGMGGGTPVEHITKALLWAVVTVGRPLLILTGSYSAHSPHDHHSRHKYSSFMLNIPT